MPSFVRLADGEHHPSGARLVHALCKDDRAAHAELAVSGSGSSTRRAVEEAVTRHRLDPELALAAVLWLAVGRVQREMEAVMTLWCLMYAVPPFPSRRVSRLPRSPALRQHLDVRLGEQLDVRIHWPQDHPGSLLSSCRYG